MLTAYAQTASAATRSAMSEHGRPEDFARAMSRLARGEAPEDAIDDQLLAEYAIAGTPEECLAQAEVYGEAGVRRISLATSLYRYAMTNLIEAAREVKDKGTFGYIDRSIPSPDLAAFMQG